VKRLIKLGGLLLFLALAAGLVMKSPSKNVYHASRSEMRALEPTFTLSLAHLPESQINRSLVAQALKDAHAKGEDCGFIMP
jgi:hypothetical protein